MRLTIVLRKDVPSRDAGEIIFELVKLRMVDHPEVKVTGTVANHFDSEEDPPNEP